MLKTFGSALALVLVALGSSPAAAQSPLVMKFGTAASPGNPMTDGAFEFAKVAGEASKGRLKVEVYHSGQLGKSESALLEGAQLGTIDLVASGSAPIGGMFEASYQALDLPFFWASRAQVWKVMDGAVGQELLRKMEAKGLKGFCFGGGWGFRNIMSNKRAVATPDDLRGQTIRVQESPTYIGMMKALGANPVPMPFGELYLAMKQGTIDGMELPPVTVRSEKFHEVTKFYSLTHHSYPPIAYFTNLRKYQAMPADLRQALDQAAKAACAMHRKMEVEKEQGDLDFIKKAGVQVNEVKDLKAFEARMGPVYEAVTAKVGKEFMDRLMAARAAAK